MKKTNWRDPKVIKLVTKEVTKSPDNLTAAFKNIAEIMSVPEGRVSQAWYNSLRNVVKGFQTKSDKVDYVNLKNSPRKALTETPIHQVIVSSKTYDGMRVVTVKQYFTK